MHPSPARLLFPCRSAFISDVHLGFEGSNPRALLSLLGALRTQTLYLVGDIIDLTCADSALEWPAAHRQVLRALLDLAQRGTRVIYIPGNHDGLLRGLDGARLGGLEIRREVLHQTADGRRFLVVHGDEFDRGAALTKPWLEALGGRAYGVLLALERQLGVLGAPLGVPAPQLAGPLKQGVKGLLRRSCRFEATLCEEVARRGVDGLICGHFHRPEIRSLPGALYCNTGDWVESCTALSEDFDGQLQLTHWAEAAEQLVALVEGEEELECPA